MLLLTSPFNLSGFFKSILSCFINSANVKNKWKPERENFWEKYHRKSPLLISLKGESFEEVCAIKGKKITDTNVDEIDKQLAPRRADEGSVVWNS
jgi:hypothetical protein